MCAALVWRKSKQSFNQPDQLATSAVAISTREMFLAVNQSLQSTQRRRQLEEAAAAVAVAAKATSRRETTDSTTQLVANMLDGSQDAALASSSKCDSCQHVQQQQQSSSCNCDCNCINKLQGGNENVGTSLVLVYLYLGALTLMLATLAILFYTYTQSTEESAKPIGLGPSAFRVQFQGELIRSEHMLRAMVTQILERDYPLMETR